MPSSAPWYTPPHSSFLGPCTRGCPRASPYWHCQPAKLSPTTTHPPTHTHTHTLTRERERESLACPHGHGVREREVGEGRTIMCAYTHSKKRRQAYHQQHKGSRGQAACQAKAYSAYRCLIRRSTPSKKCAQRQQISLLLPPRVRDATIVPGLWPVPIALPGQSRQS
jgi:hypothetical protein